jgi:hypothetical protein
MARFVHIPPNIIAPRASQYMDDDMLSLLEISDKVNTAI